ncbi:MAG TPA: permease-like cell division protein FtsX [bacterium]|nr:permease-like cell division protein FtsX [bacterium]
MGRNTIFFFQELWKNLTRNPLMTAAAASTTMVSLLTFGLSLAIITNINNIFVEITSQVEIRAFLKEKTDNYRIKQLQDEIMKLSHVRRVEYVSPSRALDKLQEDLNLSLDMPPEENPLPHTIVVRVGDPRHIDDVADRISGMDDVAELQYGAKILQGLLALSLAVKSVGYLLTLLMAIGAMFTIMNTIRLTVISRQAEIRTMKLVGATSWFIRWPFLLEGMALGVIGAVIAAGLASAGYYMMSTKAQSSLPFIIPIVDASSMSKLIVFTLLFAGVVMGLAGSFISLGRYLLEKED